MLNEGDVLAYELRVISTSGEGGHSNGNEVVFALQKSTKQEVNLQNVLHTRLFINKYLSSANYSNN